MTESSEIDAAIDEVAERLELLGATFSVLEESLDTFDARLTTIEETI